MINSVLVMNWIDQLEGIMDVEKVGKAISYLRKRAGYTQRDLADRIGISDKAVSKWERGLGLPEIGYLRKLSILLDTDTDSLLSGDVVHHDNSWKGIIVLDDNAYGIGADTIIYDKPLINYLLSYFILVGIREISIICQKNDKAYIDSRFGDGADYGIELRTIHGNALEDAQKHISADNGNVMLVYGRCILYGVDQTRFFHKAMIDRNHITMLVLPKKMSHPSTQIVMDQNMKVINSEAEVPLKTQYDFSDIPILFFPSRLLDDMSKMKNISSFIGHYATKHDVYVQMLDRGFVEIEVDDWNNVQEAGTFMKIIQDKCGMNVYCIEEVAWRRGFISLEKLREHGVIHKGTEYGEYIIGLYERIHSSQYQ